MKVYDIKITRESAERNDPLTAGWCFGLPPGIHPDQWPLDPNNGYPLVHGFTILIPEDYRAQGQDLAALSFFGTPEDMDVGEGGLFVEKDIAAVSRIDAAEPEDKDLKIFWQARRQAHPRLRRVGDADSAPYAVILLTRTEYEGSFCPPPTMTPNRYRDRIDPPAWLSVGAASAAVEISNDDMLLEIIGQPTEDLRFNRALRLERRLDDPNAGKAPRSRLSGENSDYDIGYFDTPDGEHRLHDWARRTAWLHFGGTMRPAQRIPSISPRYIEFEQYLGGFNFGGGTAQLDLASMNFNIMTL